MMTLQLAPIAPATEKLLTLTDCRTAAQCSRWAVWNWIKTGKLRAVQIGGVVRVRESDWLAFLERHTTGGGTQ
jgi:predicted DNA-binding transcriptional regulator AlpA